METYEIFKDLAIILISAKLCGLLAGKLHAPQVVGEIIAGLLIGPSILGLVQQNELISGMAEIGVVLLMFFAGLQTNLRDLMRTGWKALLMPAPECLSPSQEVIFFTAHITALLQVVLLSFMPLFLSASL